MSNQYPVNKSYGDKKDCHHEGHHHEHSHVDCNSKKVIFRCRETKQSDITVRGGQPKSVIIGNIKVKDLSCFKKPCVRIETSAIITAIEKDVGSSDIKVSLEYELLKKCDEQKDFLPLKRIEVKDIATADNKVVVLPSVPSFCDCDCECEETCSIAGKKHRCCVYQVKLIVKVEGTGIGDEVDIKISEGTISVIASEQSC